MIRISDIYKIEDSKHYILDVINSNWLSFTGKYVNKCEQKLKEILNVKHVILTNNGTSATHCIIKSIKFKYPECNKIYIPNNCYVAAYNMALLEFNENQIEILPMDSETWNLDLNYINHIQKNAALLVIHNIGNILPIQYIKTHRPDIIIIEDNCEGFMGKYYNKMSGTDCLASSISFFSNKHITCGEGGAFVTNDTDIYNKILKFTRQGISNERYIHTMLAFNYRINNIQSAILLSQLDNLNDIISKKTKLYNLYNELLSDFDKVSIQKIEVNTLHSKWLYGIKFSNNIDYKHTELFFNKNNVEIRPFFYDFRCHTHLKNIKTIEGDIKQFNIILLPLHPNLTEDNIYYIVSIINKYIQTI